MLPKSFKVVSFLFVVFSFLFLINSSAYAQTEQKSWAVQNPEDFAKCLDTTFTGTAEGQQICGEAYSGMFVPMNIVYGANCILGSVNCTTESLTPAPSTGSLQNMYYNRSVLGQTNNLIGALYENPPVNTNVWLADVASNIGIVPKTYAQGIGFSALQPLLGLWKIMRNVAYTLLILILLVIGLMIMFRTKIDPRTVISVQSAIPRIVITIIVITFSYPIAGLLIDIMYLVLFLGISVIGPLVPGANLNPNTVPALQAEFATGNGLFRIFAAIPGVFMTDAILSVIGLGAGLILFPLGAATKIGPKIMEFLGGVKTVTNAKNILVGASGLGGVIALLVIIAFIFALVRIFLILLNSYIQIIISVVFAPILLLGQAIPGQSSFSSWLRNLLSNLVVFPATAILILVADIVSREFYPDTNLLPNPLWVPPIVGSFGATVGGVLIPLGFALVIPQLVLSIKKAFGAKPQIPVTGAASRIIGQPVGIGQQFLTTLTQFRMLKPPGK